MNYYQLNNRLPKILMADNDPAIENGFALAFVTEINSEHS